MTGMINSKPPLKSLIRQYLYQIGGKIREEPKDPKLEFVFVFDFSNRTYSLAKPKKMDFVVINHGFHLGKEHKSKFDLLSGQRRKKFLVNFNNILHQFHMEYNYNFKENRIGVTTKVFSEGGQIMLQNFYDKFMAIFSCTKILINFINEFLVDAQPEDESSTGTQSTLYS